jgi:hypothetical protein
MITDVYELMINDASVPKYIKDRVRPVMSPSRSNDYRLETCRQLYINMKVLCDAVG